MVDDLSHLISIKLSFLSTGQEMKDLTSLEGKRGETEREEMLFEITDEALTAICTLTHVQQAVQYYFFTPSEQRQPHFILLDAQLSCPLK